LRFFAPLQLGVRPDRFKTGGSRKGAKYRQARPGHHRALFLDPFLTFAKAKKKGRVTPFPGPWEGLPCALFSPKDCECRPSPFPTRLLLSRAVSYVKQSYLMLARPRTVRIDSSRGKALRPTMTYRSAGILASLINP